MKNMKKWKRLLAVGMCSAMMFSMSVGVSATENQDTEETTVVETEENDEVEESVVETENQDINKPTGEIGIEEGETFGEVKEPVKTDKEAVEAQVEESKKPELITTEADFDGVNNVVFKVKNTVKLEAGWNDGSVDCVIGGMGSRTVPLDWIMSYDSNAEEIIVKGGPLWYLMRQENRVGDSDVYVGLRSADDSSSYVRLKIKYTGNNWAENDEMPKLIDGYYEFDGTNDLVFSFKNGTGNNAIKSVDKISFNIKENNLSDDSAAGFIQIYDFESDIEKGQVSIGKSLLAGLVYDEKWDVVSNVYGRVGVLVTLANGKQCMLNEIEQEDADWSFKVLEKSPDATGQHWEDVDEAFTADDMQRLVKINETDDVILRTPEDVYYIYARGTMRMIEGYKPGLELINSFEDSDINNTKVTEADFACRINFEYSGELPGTAKISIPVDNKWNGQTLYYYQVMEDRTLKDTGEKNVVKSGRYEVTQSHCSDYILLAKSPKELGVTENTDNDNNNNNTGNDNNQTGNGNNQTGNGNTQGSGNNSTTQVKPVDTTKTSPKTGDNNMILLFAVLCAGSCVVGVSTLKARRKIR